MKQQRKRSQLNDQENSPERTNNETDLIDTDFKMDIMKIFKELRKVIERNLQDHCLVTAKGLVQLSEAVSHAV